MGLLPLLLAKMGPVGEYLLFSVGLRVGLFKLTDVNDDSGGNIPNAACNAITVLSQ